MHPSVKKAKENLELLQFEEQSQGYKRALRRGMSDSSVAAKLWRRSLIRRAYRAGLISKDEARRGGAFKTIRERR